MYIRRKVYSAVEDENGEIRYFSTNEIVNEEDYLEMLYSEDYLDDDDMERLYSDVEDERYYSRSVVTPSVAHGQEVGKKNAELIKNLKAEREAALAKHKSGSKAYNKVVAEYDQRLKDLKASFEGSSFKKGRTIVGNAEADTVRAMRKIDDATRVNKKAASNMADIRKGMKNNFKAMEKKAVKRAGQERFADATYRKVGKWAKTKRGKIALAAGAGLGLAGAAGYGGYRLATAGSKND